MINGAMTKSVLIQFRVIGALLMREIVTRYGRHNIGFLWLFVEPMMFTLGVAGLWTLVGLHKHAEISIYALALTGYFCVLMWRNPINRCIPAIESNLSLLFHRNVKVIDIFASRVLLEVIGATCSFGILSAAFIALGFMEQPKDYLTLLGGILLLAWFAFAIAFVVGCLATKNEAVDRVWHVFTYLFFPLSGAAYLVNWLPDAAKHYVLYLPMVHCTEMVRHGYFGSVIRTYEDPFYVVQVNVVLSFVALMLIKRTETKARQ